MATSRRYMESSEFKARQSAFEYFCARSVEFLQDFKKECLSGWQTIFKKAAPKAQTQLKIVLIAERKY